MNIERFGNVDHIKLGTVVHTSNPALRRWRQKDQKFRSPLAP